MSEERVPTSAIQQVTIVLGERCRVVSETTADSRTLTITTEDGHICTFKGQMEFAWVLSP